MDVMVIDRDALTNQLLASKLEAGGHTVAAYQNKNEAFDVLKAGRFDCVFVDPLPLAEPKPVVIALWRHITTEIKPYIVLLSKTSSSHEAILAGANDVLSKPLSAEDIHSKMDNAGRLMGILQHLSVEDGLQSAGGMIGKAAFNQLFLSAIDRASRYGERSLIVFIKITNFDVLKTQLDETAFQSLTEQMTEKMTFMRRQSDVIAHLEPHEFCIILQRPQTESEPLDALNRFYEQLTGFCQKLDDIAVLPQLTLELIELPQGRLHASRTVSMVHTGEVEQGV